MPTSATSSIDAFKRFAAGQRSTPPQPDPPFPKIPAQIKNKFPELTPLWEEWEQQIGLWVKAKQTV